MPPGAARVLLGAGVVLGLAAALVDLVGRGPAAGPPPGAAALVNGEVVRDEDLARALGAVAADRRAPIDAAERRRVLERLVDEELLLQRAIELGLARRDQRARGDLVRAMIDLVVSQAGTDEPDDAAVAAFYDGHREWFAQPGRLRVRQVLAPDEASAREAAARLRRGEAIETVRAALGRPEVAPVPDALLPLPKLREYVGERVALAAAGLDAGGVGDPVPSGAGWHVVVVVAREPDRIPALDEVAEAVRVEMRRRAGDEALRAYLEELRGEARIAIADRGP